MRQLSDAKQWIVTPGAILALCLALTACSTPTPWQTESTANPLPKHVRAASDQSIQALEKRLTDQGMRLISQGDDYLISIPATSLFYEHSPRIRWEAYSVLNDVADYLRAYRKVSVQVSVYSNPYRSANRDYALTRARANGVASYLWSQDINTRFIYAYGEGRYKPLSAKISTGDQSLNARVEVTFKEVVI